MDKGCVGENYLVQGRVSEVNMRKTLLVMRAEIGATLRRKTFLIFAFVIPITLGIIAGVMMYVNRDRVPTELPSATSLIETAVERSGKTGFIDNSGLILALPDDVSADTLERFQDEPTAERALTARAISGYFLIPTDYLQTGDIVYTTSNYNPLADDVNIRSLEWLLMFNLLDGNAQMAESVWQPLKVEMISLAPPQTESAEESWFTRLFPTLMVLILYMVILIPAGILVSSVTDEKKNRVMEVLMSSVSPKQLLTGKIMALGILGLLEAAVWIGIMYVVASFGGQALAIPKSFTIPADLIVWSIVFFLLGYGVYGIQLAAVGALASDVKETRSANFLVMAPMILSYMFMVLIFEAPNSPVSIALSFFPLTSPIAMIARLVVADVPFWQPAFAALLLLISVLIILRMTARMFRAQLLLSGQPFSVQTYYKTLLGRAV